MFVDYNQNAPHKTVFAAWGARARVGGQVSAPFAWDELETIEPDALTIASVPPAWRRRAIRGPRSATTRGPLTRCSSARPTTWRAG